MRFNQPSGMWLIIFPVIYSFILLSNNTPHFHTLFVFIVGSIVMRSAGCVINDIIDLEYDQLVERTKSRPLASGEVSVKAALILAIVLLSLALGLLLSLSVTTIKLGFFVVLPIIIYPYCKRFTYFPQVVLGLVFNFGVIMADIELNGHLTKTGILLYVASVLWTIFYDTIYALQDIKCDMKIGVKSSAIKLYRNIKFWLILFTFFMYLSLLGAGYNAHLRQIFYIILEVSFVYQIWQIYLMDIDDTYDAFRKFKANMVIGFIIFIGFMLGKFWVM